MSYTLTTGSGTFNTLFNDPFFIGFDKMFNRLSTTHEQSGFPPYNVRKIDEDTFVVELAVAGYNKDSIEVTEHDGMLIIKGERPEDVEEYLHKGISARSFVRSWTLADHVEVTGAKSENGILTISLERKIPEEQKPKSIAISYTK